MSNAWDGYVEGTSTIQRGDEGDFDCYVSLYGAGSYMFLKLLDLEFFQQGLGNRVLWIDEPVVPPRLRDDFFYSSAYDEEWENLVTRTKARLTFLREKCETAIMVHGQKWIDWANLETDKMVKRHDIITELDDAESEYTSKLKMNVLKLAMVYAASRLSVNEKEKILSIQPHDVEMALADGRRYSEMWHSLMGKMAIVQTHVATTEVRLPTRKFDLLSLLHFGLNAEGNLFTKGEFKANINTTDGKTVAELFGLGIQKNFIKEMTELSGARVLQGKLNDKQYTRFKPTRGEYPQVFTITKEGKDYLRHYEKNEKTEE